MGASNDDLGDLIKTRIENLRPKLLDLGRRNPLISTKLTPRSASLVRVVDELPEVVRFSLVNQTPLRFVALPPLDDDPLDEKSTAFLDALSGARLSDDEYLDALNAIDANDENSADEVRRVERELKDRVRQTLGMPPRQKKAELSLQQHALINGISPHWELPDPDDENEDGRHDDNDIQTLLLPEELERRMNGLVDKCRSWEQETGINVLHVAFGFIEWKDTTSTDTSFAPLALLPVKIEKKKTREGAEFWIKSDGDETETNFVFAEKLRLDFGIDLPKYEGGSIEDYFREVADAAPPTMTWKVRRQLVVGIFPSARMAMYQDLDTQKRDFAGNDVIGALFGGSGAGGATPFADEHDTDDPAIEAKAPYLVMDADSSQFSTIVDIADGKNLAVEGPPGTGKSQTIVNTIANALAQGKKVLFVAEKMAALEVVKSRLEAVGLGEFLLPLQAERSSREQVVQSVRQRIEITGIVAPRDYENRLEKFRQTRAELAGYVEAISSLFGRTGLKIYDVLGKGIATNEALKDAPRRLQTPSVAGVENLSTVQIETAKERATVLGVAWDATGNVGPYWNSLECVPVDRFTAMELKRLASDAGAAFEASGRSRQSLLAFGLDPDIETAALAGYVETLEALAAELDQADAGLALLLFDEDEVPRVLTFLSNCEALRSKRQNLDQVLILNDGTDQAAMLREAGTLCAENAIATLDGITLLAKLRTASDDLAGLEAAHKVLKSFVDFFPPAAEIPVNALAKAGEIVRSTDNAALVVRNDLVASAGGATLLAQLVQTGRELQSTRERLTSQLSTSTDLTVSEIRSHAEALRSAGAFGWMSPSVRAAKRAYLAHADGKKFEREAACKALMSLAAFKEASQRFGEDVQARTIFGLHFKGIETDFYPFGLLADFYARVDATFSGPVHRDIRALLKTGDLDLVTAIPEISVGTQSATYADLGSAIVGQRDHLQARTNTVERVLECVAGLRNPSTIEPVQLFAIAQTLDDVRSAATAIEDDARSAELLGDRHRGEATRLADFETDFRLIDLIERTGALALVTRKLVESKQVVNAVACGRQVLANDLDAEQKLAALGEMAGSTILDDIAGKSRDETASYLAEAAADEEGVHVHSRFQVACDEMDALGYGWVVDELDTNNIPLTQLPSILEAVIFRAMAMRVYDMHGTTLARYPGTKLDELRANVAKLDREIIKLSRLQLRSNLARSARPPMGNSIGRKSDLTELALLSHETSKKTKFTPVRDLTRRAGRALLELKPCWMMSPLAVAQYLPSTAMFDLCIIDEASQMPPEDAVGALSRSQQAMVVGDTNQLPPTSFFRKMIEDEDVDEDDAVLDESILEMANGVFRPARRLRWHYRSKHSGLIAFSNQHIYDNDLIVFPSPSENRPDMGVSLVHITGRYKAGVNGEEASAMIKATLKFMREHPDRSLGLVTLNQKQRDLLLEEWNRELATDPAATRYVEKWAEENDGLERFFIKNLENVQGDERDVIFIGTVYGADKPGGPVMQRFGPIAGLAGRRRLNVLFSRAKKQIVTFSSMTAADIKAEEHTNPGAYMLRRWLEYSATGVLHGGIEQGLEPDSEFEVFVINQLRAMGFEPVPQVGVSGFRIDIGVRHPSWPHGFIMGVECDGATYHSSRSARDRDRLREQVLRGLGWDLHRIWSTDWFTDPAKEAARLRVAIERRLESLMNAPDFLIPGAVSAASTPIGDHDELDLVESDSGLETQVEIENVFPDEGTEADVAAGQADTGAEPPFVEVGDTVRVVYLQGDKASREVTLSDQRNAPELGIVHVTEPLGWALFGAEEGDEVEIRVGNSIRMAMVDRITKGGRPLSSSAKPTEARKPEKLVVEQDVVDLFDAKPAPVTTTIKLDPENFYEPSYARTLKALSCDLVDRFGPMTFRHLSELVARAHGFQRTGKNIKSLVWNAVSKERRHSRDGKGESTIWPKGTDPVSVYPFRGMIVAGEEREWPYISHPEKLGLAIEIRTAGRGDLPSQMAARIGFARLKESTRSELESLLKEAHEAQQITK